MNFNDFKEKYQKIPIEEVSNRVPSDVKVSVCVQTYNHGKYIKECLESILSQKTNFNYEILVGEDASSDNTREVCLELAKKHPDKIRLFLHHRENNIYLNGNPSGRFNMLYNFYSANGTYIAMCEGDDYWIDYKKLQKQVDFLDKNKNCTLTFSNAKVIYDTQTNGEIQNKGLKSIYESRNYLDVEFFKEWIIPTASVLFRKEILDNQYFDIMLTKNFIFGDTPLFLYASTKGDVYGMVDELTAYRKHTGGKTNEVTNLKRIQSLRHHYFQIINTFGKHLKKSAAPHIANSFFAEALIQLKRKKYIKFCTYIFQAIKYNPNLILKYVQDKI